MKENKLKSEPKDEQVERPMSDMQGIMAELDIINRQVKLIAALTAERDRAVEALRDLVTSLDAISLVGGGAAWWTGQQEKALAKSRAALAASQPSMPEPQTADSPPVTRDKT